MKKTISFFLLILLLFQSCAVYQKTSVPIYQTVDMGKAKSVNENGEKIYLEKITIKEGEFCNRTIKGLMVLV